MAKLASLVLIFGLLTTLVLLSSSPAMSQEVENENEFNYDEKSERGPQHWGDIKPEWFMCKSGTRQSPINLLTQTAQIIPNLGTLDINYNPSNATLKNRGHDIKLGLIANSSYLQINGTQYVLKQLHWHSPSEHTIDGQRLDLELHLVHQTPSGKTAVIGVLYKSGLIPDPFLAVLTKDLVAISNSTGAERAIGVIDPRLVNFERTQYYRYFGSLTTPPCTEIVTWTIIKEVKPVSRKQIELLQVVVHDESSTNIRPLQPLNNRCLQAHY